jgi:hypothetical protein
MADIKAFSEQVIDNLEKVIVGKQQSIELIVIGLLCQGHVLIEDVPGVGTQPGAFTGLHIQSNSIHAGYASKRCDRRFHLQSAEE